MAADTAKVLETLGKMTVLELVELKKAIEEEWGVTAAAPVAVAAPGAAAAGGAQRPPREEEDSFDVVLTAAGDKKIQVIKVVRAVTGPRPQGGEGRRRRRPGRRQGGAAKDEAEKIKADLEEAGASVSVEVSSPRERCDA